jgi:formate/nitrite transporter FocA (FNT family)
MDNDQPKSAAAPSPQLVTFDAILPATMAARAEENGVKRIATDPITLPVLSVLAGAFIAFGAVFATTVGAGTIAIKTADGAAAVVILAVRFTVGGLRCPKCQGLR